MFYLPKLFFVVAGLAALLILTACGSGQDAHVAKHQPPPVSEADEAHLREKLARFGSIGAISSSHLPGIYAVQVDGQTVYTDADGNFIIAGDMYRVEDQVNVSEVARVVRRQAVLKTIAPETTINYAPAGETRHVVWVFTDVDCGYCQRLHAQMQQYNDLGIEVRYLSYPRAGENSPAWRIAESIWCAENDKALLTRAKLQRDDLKSLQPSACGEKAVARGHDLGETLGLRGTPMIIDEQGRTVGGYVPPGELIKLLDRAG